MPIIDVHSTIMGLMWYNSFCTTVCLLIGQPPFDVRLASISAAVSAAIQALGASAVLFGKMQFPKGGMIRNAF